MSILTRNFYGHMSHIWINPRKIDGDGDLDDNDDDDSCHEMLRARCLRNAFYGNKSTQLFLVNSGLVPRWGLDSNGFSFPPQSKPLSWSG